METYNTILNRMKDKYKELSGFDADEASDIGIRLKILAGELFSMGSNIEWLKRQSFPNTAEGTQLDLHAEQRGILRKSQVKSKGKLKFFVDRVKDHDVEIPKGFICKTGGINSVSVETTEKGVIKSGNMSVEVPAEAREGGTMSNVAAETIKIMVSTIQEVSSVTNLAAFSGGIDAETDEELRARLIKSYRNIPNGTNCAFYRECALKYDGIYSAQAIKNGTGKVIVYVAAKGAQADSETIKALQSEIDILKEVNVQVQVKNAELLSVDVGFKLEADPDYVESEVKEACTQSIKNHFLTLGVGEAVHMADLVDSVYHTAGVKNFQFSNMGTWDVEVEAGKLAVPGTINIIGY